MNVKMSHVALAIATTVFSAAAAAATATQNLSVTASVAASCEFGAAPSLPFGALTPADLLGGKNQAAAATVTITCTNTGTAAKLYGGSTRKMLNGVNELNYEVYTDAGHTVVLGADAATGAAVTADGTAQTVSLYGKTAGGQGALPSGSYSQALALTVEF